MILGGPQKGRDRLWVGKEDNIDDSNAQRGDLILERETENQVYEGEIAHLSRENIALKDQLNRSLKELKEYQIKYPSAYMTLNDEEEGMGLYSLQRYTLPLFLHIFFCFTLILYFHICLYHHQIHKYILT
jgi:hypothetical protein